MHVYMYQLMCPKRHTQLMFAYEADIAVGREHEEAKAFLKASWERLVRHGGVNPWCGICRSTDLRYEKARTRFKTMAAAQPTLEREMAVHLTALAMREKGRRREN